MTIEHRPPRPGEEDALRRLFTESFGDAAFTELFFRTGYDPGRCFAAVDGALLAAAHWFDCRLGNKKAAYLYGIAVFREARDMGIGSGLIRACIEHLQGAGYEVIALVPAETSLFGYYARLGFRTAGTITERTVSAAAPLPIRPLSTEEYAALRRKLLPENGVLQEGPCLQLLAGYAKFYATSHAIAAVSGDTVWELLGDLDVAPGLIAALGLESATVRTPGGGRPFAMAIGTAEPIYLGLALD